MAKKSLQEKAYKKLGISKYAPWYKILNIDRNSSFEKITEKYNNLRVTYGNSNDNTAEKILEILDNAYEDVIYQFNFKTDDEIKEDAYTVLGVNNNASWFEILGVNNDATKDQIRSIANSSKDKYNSDKLGTEDPEYLQKLYKAVKETILEAAETGIEEISKPKKEISEPKSDKKIEDKTYKGHKTKYYKEYSKLDELGGLNYLAKELQTKTTSQIAKELFNLNNGSLISQYCKFNNTSVSKIKSDYSYENEKTEIDNAPSIRKSKICPNCGKSVMKNASICHHCGNILKAQEKTKKDQIKTQHAKTKPKSKYKICPTCGKEVNEVRNHCPNCKHDFTNRNIPKTSTKKEKTKKDQNKTQHAKTCPQCGQKFYSKNIKKCTKCGYNFSTEKTDVLKCPYCGKSFLKSGHRYSTYRECPHCKRKISDETTNTNKKIITPSVSHASDEKTEIDNAPSIRKSKICPNCGKSVMKNASICHHCGNELKTQEKTKQTLKEKADENRRKYYNLKSKPCPNCGETIYKNNKICPYCGYDSKKEKGFLRRLFSASKTKICPACNELNEEHFNYCKRCGYNFKTERIEIIKDKIKCPECGNFNDITSNFCVECGKKLNN